MEKKWYKVEPVNKATGIEKMEVCGLGSRKNFESESSSMLMWTSC